MIKYVLQTTYTVYKLLLVGEKVDYKKFMGLKKKVKVGTQILITYLRSF